MLIQQTLDKLGKFRLFGMAQAVRLQLENPDLQAMTFDERLGLAVDEEDMYRDNRRRERLLRQARLKIKATPEGIDYRPDRGIERSLLTTLFGCDFVGRGQNVVILGPAGSGKTHIGCALSYQACRKGISALYLRVPNMLENLETARADGSLRKERAKIAKAHVLLLDDWGISELPKRGPQELLEVIDNRPENSSIIVTSQLPVAHWHDWIGEKTLADAILDRLIHSAHRIELKGESERKRRGKA